MTANGSKDFYDILGVTKSATQDDLRKAWLGLARKHHPDKTGGHKGSEQKLKLINEAYDTLKRPEKRKQYDDTLSGSFEPGTPFTGSAPRKGPPRSKRREADDFAFNGEYGDFFSEIFGQASQEQHHRARPGRNLETQVSISLKEAATGSDKSFRLPMSAPCQVCSGTGAAPGSRTQQCPQCKGIGHVSGSGGSFFVMSQKCPLCHGRGEIVTTPCQACKGSGVKAENRTLSISIPPGVKTGTRLRLAGQGEPGEPGAPEGDLFVVISIEANDLFHRERNDILCNMPITFSQAVLGASVEVPTLHGKAKLTIPAGTQTNTVLRMRGQGFPSINGDRTGDQLVKLIVETPQKISADQTAAIRRLDEEGNPNAYPMQKAFLERFKRWCER